jgi:hemolysin III
LRDPVSSVSHLLAAGWAVYAALILLRLTPPVPGRRPAMAVFGGSMVLLYLASGVYHAVPYTPTDRPALYRFFQAVDRSAVYLLIAGTNTPVMVALLDGRWRRRCLAGMWGLAAAGVAALWLLPAAPFWLTVAVYVGMGWLGAVPLARYLRAVGWRGMRWAVAGGVLYTAGAVCDLGRWPTLLADPVLVGPHEVFHLATVGGSLAFYAFVARYVVGYAPPPAGARPADRADGINITPVARGLARPGGGGQR